MNRGGSGIIGLILAGGQARRMGGIEKAFVLLDERPLIGHVIDRALPQVDELLINANAPERFASYGREIVADRIGGFLGPLAGILSGLEWVKEHRPSVRWLATFPCDTPFVPEDYVARLIARAENSKALVAAAASQGRRHNVCAVWSTAIAETAESVLSARGFRKMDDFIDSLPHAETEFSADPIDPFFNINTAADLARASELARQSRG